MNGFDIVVLNLDWLAKNEEIITVCIMMRSGRVYFELKLFVSIGLGLVKVIWIGFEVF